MSELVAVLGDQDDHLGGNLLCDNNSKVFISGKLVALVGSSAIADALHLPPLTNASTGSSKVFVGGIAVHRNNDLRNCLSKTVVSGQSGVFCG